MPLSPCQQLTSSAFKLNFYFYKIMVIRFFLHLPLFATRPSLPLPLDV